MPTGLLSSVVGQQQEGPDWLIMANPE